MLAHRRAGRSVLFMHHAGKGGQQRGTSKREDALDVALPFGPAAGRVSPHLEVFQHGQGGEHLPALGHMGDAEMGALVRRHGEQVAALERD